MLQPKVLICNIAGLAAAAIFFAQCKPQALTKVQSLDDAARGSDQIDPANLCGDNNFDINHTTSIARNFVGSNQLDIRFNADENAQTAMINAVLTVIARIPSGLLTSFLVFGQGHIVIGSADSACAAVPFTKEERVIFGNNKVRSCWIGPGSSNNNTMQLYLDNDVKLIRFSLLRLMAYTYAEYYIKLLSNSDFARLSGHSNPYEVKAFVDGFTANRTRLAQSFLKDMSNAKNANFITMSNHFKNDPESFGNMVYANAVDSYYCSDHTKDVFQKSFPLTWSVFNDNNDPQTPLKQLGTPSP